MAAGTRSPFVAPVLGTPVVRPLAVLTTGLILICAWASPLAAQQLLATQPEWTSAGGGPAIEFLVADIDADGDPDVLRIHRQQPSQLFLNHLGVLEGTPSWVSLFTREVTGAALGDMDGDGRLDIALATLDGDANVYFQKSKSTIFGPLPDVDIPMQGATAIALASLAGKREADVVTSHPDSGLAVRRNMGRGQFTAPVWRAAGSASRIALADVDRDGQLDLVAAGDGNPLRLYRGDRAVFETTPAWNVPGAPASNLALGDLDGDGDLDLVTAGATPVPPRIWENLGSTFGLTPAFEFVAEDSTVAVALADADGDGDLDLALANADRSRVHRRGSGLSNWTQAWQSPDPAATAVAWVDIEGDGHRDLVLARGQTEWFRNLTPLFTAQARSTAVPGTPGGGSGRRWRRRSLDRDRGTRTGPRAGGGCVRGDAQVGECERRHAGRRRTRRCRGRRTRRYRTRRRRCDRGAQRRHRRFNVRSGAGVDAMGDVDSDGDLDLVAGSARTEEIRLYVNRNGTFAAPPDWVHRFAIGISSLALGDIDADGDLDLAVGSRTHGAACFAYFQGDFGEGPFWTPQDQVSTSEIFLDDTDSDGRLDIVLANDGFSMVFANQGGFFATAPTTTAPTARRTDHAALDDLDGDGDLDIMLFSGSGDVSDLYPNIRGGYAPAAPLPAASYRGVEVADTDQDGDYDIVAGTATTIQIFDGTPAPAFRGDPTAPVHQLPGNDAFVRGVRLTAPTVNVRRVELTAVDIESDSLWLVTEYQSRGSSAWLPIASPSGRGRIGPLAASPAGTVHSFDWELERIASTELPLVMRLRPTPFRSRTSSVQRIPDYLHALGRVDVRRPEVTVTPTVADLPTVTVGDTTFLIFDIRNRGTVALQIHSFDFERTTMMRTNPPAPLEIGAGQRAEVFVYYEPTDSEPTAPPGAPRLFHIVSNDPIYGRVTVEIQADALSLAGRAQALVPDRIAPLGEPIVVQAIPQPLVHVESARLYYGVFASDTFQQLDMAPFGASFIGIIPGSDATERGVQFYVEFENSGITATDPLGAPLDSVFAVPIDSPSFITVLPQPTSRADFLVGRDINVQVIVPEGAEFKDGTLHYRLGGDQTFKQTPVELGISFQNRATIPAQDITARGLEYWVEVQTATRHVQYPLDGELTPDSIRTLVPSLVEPVTTPGGRYRMLSVPLDYGADSPDALDVLLSDQPEFGPYDPVRWRAFRFMGDATGNVERRTGDSAFFVKPGRAFWLISRDAHRVDTAPAEGLSVSVSQSFPIALDPGWNQIGAPFAFPVEWTAISVPEGVEPPVAFDPARGTRGDYVPEPATRLEPFQGYFVYNTTDSVLTLKVPPVAAPVDTGAVNPKTAGTYALSPGCFTIDVTARGAVSSDGGNRAGVDAGAVDAIDVLDAHEPPSAPEDWVRAAFVAGESSSHFLRRDVRSPNADGHTWHLDVRSSAAAREVTLELQIAGDVPPGGAPRCNSWRTDPIARTGCAWSREHPSTSREQRAVRRSPPPRASRWNRTRPTRSMLRRGCVSGCRRRAACASNCSTYAAAGWRGYGTARGTPGGMRFSGTDATTAAARWRAACTSRGCGRLKAA